MTKGPKIERYGTCAFQEREYFNNLRKYGKFGTNLVDSMLNTLATLELANVLSHLLTHENIDIPSAEQVLGNDLFMEQLEYMLSEAWSE